MSKPADLKGDRRRRSADHAHPRRRGDRVRDPLHVRPGRSRHAHVVESDRLRRTSAFGGRAEMSWAEPYVAETSTAAFFRVAWGRSASNCVHPPSAATQTHSLCGKFALERGAAGRGAKLAFNELGAISFTMRGRADRNA